MKFLDNIICRSPLFPYKGDIDPALFKEALYLGSVDLYHALEKWEQGLITDPKEIRKLQISLYKYESRSRTRCTPFGLFAGVGMARWGAMQEVRVSENDPQKQTRKTRLDMNVSCSITQELQKKPYIRAALRYYPNNSLYAVNDAFRYVEYEIRNVRRMYKLSKVDRSGYLEALLEAAAEGQTTASLAEMLTGDEVSQEEALAFIHELIDAQLLVSELEASVTGKDFFSIVVEIILRIASEQPGNTELQGIAVLLTDVQRLLGELDSNVSGASANMERYKKIHALLQNILPEIQERNLFQADLFKSYSSATVGETLQQELKDVSIFLNRIGPKYYNPQIDEFKKRFLDRYEAQEIPLLQALDMENGIGYPLNDKNGINPLADGLFLKQMESSANGNWGKLETALNELVQRSIRTGETTVRIRESDFNAVDDSTPELASSMNFMFRVINEKQVMISSSGGSSAANLIGRFAHGDARILETVQKIAAHESEMAGDRILAEIAHLPESRMGNILARPVFRDYEIPYLAKSTLEKEFQLPLQDLYVSVKNNKIIIRSKRLNKEIIPRLASAHNYSSNTLPVYRFLSELQTQYFERSAFVFRWGELENVYDMLPRVEYKSIILSAAKWHLHKKEYAALIEKNLSTAQQLQRFQSLKTAFGLPKLFLLADGDNELLIDTEKEIAVLAFIDAIKQRDSVRIEEFIFDTQSALIKNENGNVYNNECIVMFLNNSPALKDRPSQLPASIPEKSQPVKQSFSLGSEWLYYKIYCGVKTADVILTETLLPAAQQLLEENAIDKWFFIRYNDPESHLRFRLYISDPAKYGRVIQLISSVLETMVEEQIIFKLQTDTYLRELRRYGTNSIALSETLFYHDSVCIANALQLLDAESGAEYRWQFALRATDRLLDDLRFSQEEKQFLMDQLSNGFFNEHGGNKELRLQLDNKFRAQRKKIEEALDPDAASEAMQALEPLLRSRSAGHSDTIALLLDIKNNNALEIDLYDLTSSYIHMMLNRLFMAKNRLNEMVVYDMLARHYRSVSARQKAKTKTGVLVKA